LDQQQKQDVPFCKTVPSSHHARCAFAHAITCLKSVKSGGSLEFPLISCSTSRMHKSGRTLKAAVQWCLGFRSPVRKYLLSRALRHCSNSGEGPAVSAADVMADVKLRMSWRRFTMSSVHGLRRTAPRLHVTSAPPCEHLPKKKDGRPNCEALYLGPPSTNWHACCCSYC
jgi:hypothetical protein